MCTVQLERPNISATTTGTAVNNQSKEERKNKVRTVVDVKQMIHDSLHHPESMPLMGPPGTDDKLLKPLAMFANRSAIIDYGFILPKISCKLSHICLSFVHFSFIFLWLCPLLSL